MDKFIFLDRDGVLNENREDYVRSYSELKLLPGTKEALKLLKNSGYKIIIITNQAAVGRGFITEKELQGINRRLNEAMGGLIDDFFYCPHTPEDNCDCRKPRTRLLRDAAEKYNIELEGKWMVGDNAKDIQLGQNAGLNTILVLTGLGHRTLKESRVEPDVIAENLLEAVKWLLEAGSTR